MLYQPFPAAEWRTVKTAPEDFTGGAAIYRRLTLQRAGEAAVDLTHIGALSFRVVANEPQWGLLQLVFPNVSNNGDPVTARVRIHVGGKASGTVRSGDTVLGKVSGTGFDSMVTWRGECAGNAAP